MSCTIQMTSKDLEEVGTAQHIIRQQKQKLEDSALLMQP